MNNFTYSIPTKVHFGKGQIEHLKELKESGEKVLLVYGGGSIKKSGIYDHAMKILKEAGLQVYELSGIEPNPRIESVEKGVSICKKEKIDMVLSIGGGSTIDAGKMIAAGACSDEKTWELVLHPEKIQTALPIYSVVTLAATGSEMDEFAVVSDLSKNEKWVAGSEFLKPKMTVMDPTYTFSVSKKQTAAGTADMISHIFENYFTNVEHADVQAYFSEGLLKNCFHYGPIAYEQPDNYDARANLMWTSSMAINGILSGGAEVAWCVHPMEHELSAFYDITHGVGLAILTPHWMEYALNEKTAKKFARYGRNVWNLSADEEDMEVAKKAIECTKEFFRQLDLPNTLTEVGIDEKNFDIMAQKAADGCVGSFVELKKDDIVQIFKNAL